MECRTPDSTGSYVSELTPYQIPGWFALENCSVCGGNGHSPLTLFGGKNRLWNQAYNFSLCLAACWLWDTAWETASCTMEMPLAGQWPTPLNQALEKLRQEYWVQGRHSWSTEWAPGQLGLCRVTLLSEKERKIKCPTTFPLHCLEDSVPNTAVSVSIFVSAGICLVLWLQIMPKYSFIIIKWMKECLQGKGKKTDLTWHWKPQRSKWDDSADKGAWYGGSGSVPQGESWLLGAVWPDLYTKAMAQHTAMKRRRKRRLQQRTCLSGETVAHYQINVDRDKSGVTERRKTFGEQLTISQHKYMDNFKCYCVILSGNFSPDID